MKRSILLWFISAFAWGQLPEPSGSGGGGTAAPPYEESFTSAGSLTVTVATHGMGTNPIPLGCWNNASPRVPITMAAGFPTVAANGDVVFDWTGTLSGICKIISGSASGTAGGHLSGTYPNPSVANDVITAAMLASAAKQGNGTKVQLFAGSAPGTDDCAKFDANGNITGAGAACGSGSGGISTLNTLSGATQTFAAGTSGTDFAISSFGTTHTFNLPDASLTARGPVTTGSQSFAGAKLFRDPMAIGPSATDAVQLSIRRGTALATSNIVSFQDQANGELSAIDKDGKFTGNAATATALAANGGNCAADNFALGVDASGAAECAQPAFSNLSGSIALAQTVLTTRGDILTVNSTPVMARLPLGAAKKVLVSDGSDAVYRFPATRSHATDCTALTDGNEGETCFEQDADTLYVCEPTAGLCDTAGEWRQIAGGGGLSGSLAADRIPFASGPATLVDSANFRYTTDVSFDRLFMATAGSGVQFKRAAGANILQLRRYDDADAGTFELGTLRSKNSSGNDRFVVDPGAATITIPSTYLNMTGGTMGWPSTTVASLPAAASNTAKVYVVTDAASAGDCASGGGSERAICRSDGSTWQSIGRDGGGGSGCTTTGLDNQVVTDNGAGGCTSEAQWTITSNVLTSGASGKVDLSAASGTDGFTLPVAAGAAPTANGKLSFDSTGTNPVFGSGGSTYDILQINVGAGLSSSVSGPTNTLSVDTAVIAALDTIQRNTALYLADAGASDAYSASPTPTPTGSIATGSVWTLKANTANTGASSLDVDAGGALASVAIKYANGSTDTATGDILAGDFWQFLFDGTAMRLPPVVLNSGNVRGKLPLANMAAPSAGQFLYSSDGVSVTGRTPLASDVTNAFDLTADNALGAHYFSISEMTPPGNPAADVLRVYAKDDAGTTKLCSKDSAGTETCGLGGGGGGSPGGSGSEVQYRAGASTFGAITGSSVSGRNVTFAGDTTLFNETATTGVTRLIVKAGEGQSTNQEVSIRRFDNSDAIRIDTGNNRILFMDAAGDQYASLAQTLLSGASTFRIQLSSGTINGGSMDTGICRNAAGQIGINDGSGTCTNFRDLKLRELVVTTGTEGTCDSTNRGRIVFVAGGASVADTWRICRKDGSDNYAFVALF